MYLNEMITFTFFINVCTNVNKMYIIDINNNIIKVKKQD